MNRLLRSGFAHVKVVLHQPGALVQIDPVLGVTDVMVVPDTYRIKTDPDETSITVSRLVEVERYRGYLRPITCVEQVKALLGIKSLRIVTPYQLYRSLKK